MKKSLEECVEYLCGKRTEIVEWIPQQAHVDSSVKVSWDIIETIFGNILKKKLFRTT